jgi:hypothetical protein
MIQGMKGKTFHICSVRDTEDIRKTDTTLEYKILIMYQNRVMSLISSYESVLPSVRNELNGF